MELEKAIQYFKDNNMEVTNIDSFKKDYWEFLGCEKLEEMMVLPALDTAIDLGPVKTASLLAKLKEFQPTLLKVKEGGFDSLDLQRFIIFRLLHYFVHVMSHAEDVSRLQGWIHRAIKVYTEGLKYDAGQ